MINLALRAAFFTVGFLTVVSTRAADLPAREPEPISAGKRIESGAGNFTLRTPMRRLTVKDIACTLGLGAIFRFW